jgi:hypothetical protein
MNLCYDQLVGGAITILKNDGVRQWEGSIIPYIRKIKAMFETTNHITIIFPLLVNQRL